MSLFTLKSIPIDFSDDDIAQMKILIVFATLLKDSRIAIISKYQLCDYEIHIINPNTSQVELSFGRCGECYFKIEGLPNGHLIVTPSFFIFDISDPNSIQKYKTTKKGALEYALLPDDEMALIYHDSKIEIYQSVYPYLLKDTLFEPKTDLQGLWVKFVYSINMLMACFIIGGSNAKNTRYTSLHFFDLEKGQCVTSIKFNHCNLIFSNIIELKDFKLLVEDEDSFYVLNLESFIIEEKFDYKLNDYESCLNINVPFLIRIDNITQSNLQFINDKSNL